MMTTYFVIVLFLTAEGVAAGGWEPLPQDTLQQCEEKVDEVFDYLNEAVKGTLFFVACVEVTETGEKV